MSIVMQLQDVAESTRLGPLSGEVRAGEILHLVGPNGAGKTSVLRGDGDWIIGATRFCRNAPKPSRFYSRQLCCCGYQSGIIGNQHLG